MATMARKLEVRRNVIKVTEHRSKTLDPNPKYATHEVTGILPGCRKVVLLSISPRANAIEVRPLFGYNGVAATSPSVWADLIQHAEIISDPLFPVELTPELKAWARAHVMSICSCPAVTDLSRVHPNFLAQQTHDRVIGGGYPMTVPTRTEIITNEVLEAAGTILRRVQKGGSFDAVYFTNVTLAVEALRDGNAERARIFLDQAEKYGTFKYALTWGAGEQEQGTQEFPTLNAVRGMLAHDTDLNADQIEQLIAKGKRSDADDDPQAATQFDCAWIRLERIPA